MGWNVFPVIGELDVGEITIDHILTILAPHLGAENLRLPPDFQGASKTSLTGRHPDRYPQSGNSRSPEERNPRGPDTLLPTKIALVFRKHRHGSYRATVKFCVRVRDTPLSKVSQQDVARSRRGPIAK